MLRNTTTAGTSAGGYGSELQIDMDMAITATADE